MPIPDRPAGPRDRERALIDAREHWHPCAVLMAAHEVGCDLNTFAPAMRAIDAVTDELWDIVRSQEPA